MWKDKAFILIPADLYIWRFSPHIIICSTSPMYIFFRNISLINLVSLCAFNLGDFKGIACLVVQIVWLNLNSVWILLSWKYYYNHSTFPLFFFLSWPKDWLCLTCEGKSKQTLLPVSIQSVWNMLVFGLCDLLHAINDWLTINYCFSR